MADSKKSMDVSKPGKSTPDATSRPVIIGHKPLIKQDPMVSPASSDEGKDESGAKPLTPHNEKVLQPIDDEKKETETPKSELKEEAESEKPKLEEKEPEPEKSESQGASSESAIVDAVAEQAKANKKNSGELTEEEKKKQEEVKKLIENKKYYVPIKVASRKRNAKWSLVFLLLLLIVAGAYLALDAGIVNPGVKLPVDIIKT